MLSVIQKANFRILFMETSGFRWFKYSVNITLKLYLFVRDVTASASSKRLYNVFLRIRSKWNRITPLFRPGKPWSSCDDCGSPNLKLENSYGKSRAHKVSYTLNNEIRKIFSQLQRSVYHTLQLKLPYNKWFHSFRYTSYYMPRLL